MNKNSLFKFFISEYKNHKYTSSYSNVLKVNPKRIFSFKSIFLLHIRLINSLFIPKRAYKKENIIFANLTRNYVKYISKVNYKYSIIVSDRSNLKNIFSRFSAFYVIFHLINYPKIWIFGINFRKFFIRKMISKIYFLCSNNPTFVLRADLVGSDSVLASLNKSFKNIQLISIQHGLYSYSDFPKYPFPGIRSNNFILHDEIYIPLWLTHIPKYKYLISPPPPLMSINSNHKQSKQAIFFVSGKNLENKIYINFCYELKKIASFLDTPFYVCPHSKDIQDIKYLKEKNIRYKFSKDINFDDFDPNKTLFIGIHTTFLYEIASSGFKTLWIRPDSSCPPEDSERKLLLPTIENAFYLNIKEVSRKNIKKILKVSINKKTETCIFSNPELIREFKKNSEYVELNKK